MKQVILVMFLYLSAEAVDIDIEQLGKIRGLEEHGVYKFLGVPFVKPANGNKRWTYAEKIAPVVDWTNNIIDGTKYGPACYQKLGSGRNYTMSEDCLHLNIYTPGYSNATRSVMVWIHGGGYARGASFEYDGSLLAELKNLVVVSINYRLNIFGNFDPDGSGKWQNFALDDMEQALIWIRDNIRYFGGNKDSVTIFGGSAGGMAVTQLASSPKQKSDPPLFHRVISESGTLVCPKLMTKDSKKLYKQVSDLLKCDNSNPQCLKSVDADTLMAKSTKVMETNLGYFPFMYRFAPFTDGVRLDHPFERFEYMKDNPSPKKDSMVKSFRSYDLMIGFNSNEGSLMLSYFKRLAKESGYDLEDGINGKHAKQIITELAENYFPSCSATIKSKLMAMYFSGGLKSSPNPTQGTEALRAYADLLFTAPAAHLADLHSQGKKKTYMYIFNEKVQPETSQNAPSWFEGARHTDERMFVFGIPPSFYSRVNYTQAEIQLRDAMMSAWSDFAKTGNPGGNWQQYSAESHNFKTFGRKIQEDDPVIKNTWKIAGLRDECNSGEYFLLSNFVTMISFSTFLILQY